MEKDSRLRLPADRAGARAEGGGRAASEEESRQAQPQRETRPQLEKELFPDYYQRKQRERGGRE